MTGELGQDEAELYRFYKNTCHARQISFAELKANYMNTEISDEEQSRPSAEVPRPPALRAPQPQDTFSWTLGVRTAEEGPDPFQDMTLTPKHIEIMKHTRDRAAGGYYCGDSREMQELVTAGLMAEAGRKSFVPDPYFKLTSKGSETLRQF